MTTTLSPPTLTSTIPVCRPVLDGREREYVLDALESGWISSQGEYITRFEAAFAGRCGARYGVACCNGTAAIHLALAALDIGPGDEVIIPALTLIASANMVHLTGATPVLVDVCSDTWCIDPARIETAVTPRTRAIIVVHLYGHPCDMTPIMEVARRHRLSVIEDAAEAHGALYHEKAVGAIGHLGVFSFYGNKIITTGEGGMVVTNDGAFAERLRLLRNQAFGPARFVHHHVGFNYRLTNVQAAIGLAQCERLDEKVRRKREMAAVYNELLGDEPDLQSPVERPDCRNVYWMYGVVLRPGFGRSRDEVVTMMASEGVETRPFFVPMNRQPVYDGSDPRRPDLRGHYPVSERLGDHGLYLPSSEDLSRAEQRAVVEALLRCRA